MNLMAKEQIKYVVSDIARDIRRLEARIAMLRESISDATMLNCVSTLKAIRSQLTEEVESAVADEIHINRNHSLMVN